MKKFVLCNALFFIMIALSAQPKAVKNVIVMIPDGTSTSLLAAARWYQTYQNTSETCLHLDPYLRGLLNTHSSDAPIGDSAPTTACYMTGQPTQTGFVSTYPVHTDHDLVFVDSARAYQPLATLLEGAKQLKHKSAGLVFTCEFPHATPADCAAHTYDRGQYGAIAPQMVGNLVDVVIGGGVSFLNEKEQSFLNEHGYSLFLNDRNGMNNCANAPMWALYDPACMAYEMERDTATTPSLSEMTRKAIDLLSKNPNGFFLMVEGSKVDWAAHDNDAKAAITDFLAFDEAFGTAVDFAKKNGETVVVVMPDHGTSAITIGSSFSNHGYDKMSLEQIMASLDNYNLSTSSMAQKLKDLKTSEWPELFLKYFNIQLSDADIAYLQSAKDYSKSSLTKEERKGNLSLSKMLGQFLYARTVFGFTTFGHTGENVFYAMYHPADDVLNGFVTNVQMHQYLCRQLGLKDSLSILTQDIYADHHQVFADYKGQMDSLGKYDYRLTVKNKRNTLVADSYTNYVMVNNKKIELSSVIVYMPINETFYLPKNLYKYLEK